MKKGLTEMVFILDKSGSMSGYEEDTIGGFNAMIEAQKKVDGEAYVSTVLFSNHSNVIHDRIKLQDVPLLTEKEYFVGGCTALIDAIGDAIHHIKNIHKYAREEDVPEKTVFIITTDGYENASDHWASDDVKGNIAEQEQNGWEFIFLGANIDAVETGDSFGIRHGRCVNYDKRDSRAMSMYTSKRLYKLRKGEDFDDDMNVSYSAITEDEMKQMEELSRKLEKEAKERAQKSAADNGGDPSDNNGDNK